MGQRRVLCESYKLIKELEARKIKEKKWKGKVIPLNQPTFKKNDF